VTTLPRQRAAVAPPADAPGATGRRRAGVPAGIALLVAAAVAGGAVLRFVARSHLWLDEAQSVATGLLPLGEIADALRADGFPPLFYWLLHGWLEAFGDGDAAARALAGVAGVAALGAVWLAGRHLGGDRVAWGATAFLAASPFAIRYSTEVRMYSLLLLVVSLAVAAVVRGLSRPSWPALAAVAASTAALLLLHYWALYLLAAAAALVGWQAWRRRDRAAVLVLAAGAVGAAAFLPWVGTLRYQLEHTGTPWSRGTNPLAAMEKTFSAWGGGPHVDARLLALLLVVLAVLGVVRGSALVRAVAATAALALALGVVVATATGSAFQPRYTAVAFPLVVLVAAVGLASVVEARRGAAVLGLVVVLGLVGGWRNAGDERSQAGEVAEAIEAEMAAGDVVVFCPDQLGPGVTRLLPPRTDTAVYPTGEDGSRVDWVDYEERNEAGRPAPFAREVLGRADAARATVWYVWSPNYRTYGTSCETLEQELEATGRTGTRLVRRDRGVPERAWLTRYGPR
jgi:mannosyltransferase